MNIKRSDYRTSKWNLFFNYSSIFYNIIIAIVLVPLYLKYIPSDEYGAWLAATAILTWISLIDPGLGGVLQYKIAFSFGLKDYTEIGKLIGNSLIIAGFFTLILILGTIFTQFNLSKWIEISAYRDSKFMLAFAFSAISTVILVFSYNIQGINYGLQSSLGIGLVFTVMNIIGILSLIYFLTNHYGLLSFAYSSMIKTGIYLTGNIIYLNYRMISDEIKPKVELSGIRELLSLIGFNLIGKFCGTLQGRMFEFLIAKYVSHPAVTSFRVTQSAPDSSKLVLIRPFVALMPVFSRLFGSGNLDTIKYRLRQMFLFFTWFSTFIFFAFWLYNESFINLWVGPKFYIGSTPNLLVCILVIIAALADVLGQIVWAIGLIKQNNLTVIIQFIIFLPLSIITCKNFGIIGLLLSSIGSYLAVSIPYFIYLIYHKLFNNTSGFKLLILEFIKSTAILGLVSTIFYNPKFNSWYSFMFECIEYSMLYFVLLFLISKEFKCFIKTITRKFLLMFK